MKFLHTSDWHLGKLFHEKSLIEDQEYVLNQIIDIAKKAEEKGEPYAALVVSGDIYDRALPPADATQLLNRFLVKVAAELPELHIFMNSGNHDSATRLAFASEFLAFHNIHIATDIKNMCTPVIVERNGEKAAFYQLPFLTPQPVKSEEPGEILKSQEELYGAVCSLILESHRKNYGDMPSVINAHLFTSGSETGSSERANVGTLEQVSVSHFKDFTYGAFGHIHRFQACDKEKHCYYPGSLLPYNFDDSPECGILEVEIDCSMNCSGAGGKNTTTDMKSELEKPPVVNRILLKPLHKISKVKAQMKDLIGSGANKALISENADNYVQVILTDEVMPTEAFSNLKTVFPFLLSVTSEARTGGLSGFSTELRRQAILSNEPEKIFDQFMSDLYGVDFTCSAGIQAPFEKQRSLFLEEAVKTSE